MQDSIKMRRAFAAMVRSRSELQRTARIEQATAVCDFRTDAEIDEVRWSVLMTDFSIGNGDQFGYFVH